MQLHIHHHLHSDYETKRILNYITHKLNQMEKSQQERFDALMGRLNSVTNDIAQDYKTLLDAVKDDISEESFAKAEENIAKLEALGSSVENPIPEEPPVGEPPVEEPGNEGTPA